MILTKLTWGMANRLRKDMRDGYAEASNGFAHAYIIQCNDRQYGDSRIRAPFTDSWKRDVLRIKGGIADYCVIGEIDVQALRQFQSSYRSPSKPFKPVPDGFEISYDRKVLPAKAEKGEAGDE